MCGIVGIAGYSNGPTAAGADVERMASTIVHRGPDDAGTFVDAYVALAMRRLSIIDLDGGHQPIVSEDGGIVAVCNGEIYNHRVLRRELEQRGHRFRSCSDTEVLVHLYEESGDSLLDRIDGMFAFAIWDSKAHRLLLARDRAGMKPLYFVKTGETLAFASEMKALLVLPGVARVVDPAALAEYLRQGYAAAPATPFRHIRKLAPATALSWSPTGLHEYRYWRVPISCDTDRSEADLIEEVRAALSASVQSHLMSDVPLGAFLSGGIDSSAVVALMAQDSSAPVSTYSVGYAGGSAERYYNELQYARLVADRHRTRHHDIIVSPDVASLLPRVLWHVEEPICDTASLTTWLVAELAARDVKVILSGVGGDELFAGYRRYLGSFYDARYRRLPRGVREFAIEPLLSALPAGRGSRLADLVRYARRFTAASGLEWQEQYRAYVEVATAALCSELLVDHDASLDRGFDRIAASIQSGDELSRLLQLDAATQLPEQLLLLTDKVTMAHSIECRVPFLDRRLFELAASVPGNLRMPGGRMKHLLKRAVAGLVPDEILHRGKRGFGAPVGPWLKRELRPLRDELLGPRSVSARGLLHPGGVRRVQDLHDAGREDFTDLLFALMSLEIWARIMVDERSPEDVGGELQDRSVHAARRA